jgi:L-serine dehydratase
MPFISILNDVLGPVMPGPSSSHTAGSYHLGRLARSLWGDRPSHVTIFFDRSGSYGRVYRAQGVDLGFAAGLMDWPLTDRRFPRALSVAAQQGLRLDFRVTSLPEACHPNFVRLRLESAGASPLVLEGRSTGGGGVVLDRLDDWAISIDGKSCELLVQVEARRATPLRGLLRKALGSGASISRQSRGDRALLWARSPSPLPSCLRAALLGRPGVESVRTAEPLFFPRKGSSLFLSADRLLRLAARRKVSLGRMGLAYESQLLGLSEGQILAEIVRRYEVMHRSLDRGLAGRGLRLSLLEPSAARVWDAERRGRVAVGGISTRAAARALAIAHTSCSGGVVCAAPTGGSAGALPAAVISLVDERRLSPRRAALALLAAGAVGVVVAVRATFAAETAGCQVEIGAAGAMAAAAVVELAGGTARQACDAAAVSFQNTMGSVCDLVQGRCEIPCHTRNAAAAASAFVCADLVLGGYHNPIPLDETIDAAYATGRMLPPELRCTARGGLALAPAARALGRRRSRRR